MPSPCVHTPTATSPCPVSDVPSWGSTPGHASSARSPQHPTAAAASLQPAPRPGARSHLSILRAMFAQSTGWEPGARAAPPRPKTTAPARPARCCGTSRSQPPRDAAGARCSPSGTDAAGNDQQAMLVSAGKSPAVPCQPSAGNPSILFHPKHIPAVQSGKSREPRHLFASQKHPKPPARTAALLSRLSRRKPARATEQNPQEGQWAELSPSRPTPAPRAARCGPAAARHASPRPPEQPTTTNWCVSDKGKKLGEETILSSALPERIL